MTAKNNKNEAPQQTGEQKNGNVQTPQQTLRGTHKKNSQSVKIFNNKTQTKAKQHRKYAILCT